MFDDSNAVERVLSLLGAALEAVEAGPYELVVVGGAAMSVLGIGVRATKDIDVLGLREPFAVTKYKPLPDPLIAAVAAVADALQLDADWLNARPADLLDHGLPEGFEGRLTVARFGPRLAVWYPSREDLICLKTYAAADLGPGRHTEDLQALHPSCEELLAGARWAQSQDPSEAFRGMLAGLLAYFGCETAGEELSHE